MTKTDAPTDNKRGLILKIRNSPKKVSVKIRIGAQNPNHSAPYWLIRLAKAEVSMALSRPVARNTTPTIKRKVLFINADLEKVALNNTGLLLGVINN